MIPARQQATSATLNTVCSTANNIVGGSGGPSAIYAKPSWQSGITPNGIAAGDQHRYTPDCSFVRERRTAKQELYLRARRCRASWWPTLGVPGRTAQFWRHRWYLASSPAFAAIMALINQTTGVRGTRTPCYIRSPPPQDKVATLRTEALAGSPCAFKRCH